MEEGSDHSRMRGGMRGDPRQVQFAPLGEAGDR